MSVEGSALAAWAALGGLGPLKFREWTQLLSAHGGMNLNKIYGTNYGDA